MAVIDLYSTRQKRLRGEVPEVYVYDSLADGLRVQIVHIWREAFGTVTDEMYGSTCPVLDAFRAIHQMLSKEFGVFALRDRGGEDAFTAVANFFLGCRDVERALDVIELAFCCLNLTPEGSSFSYSSRTAPADAIKELNERLKQHGVGYCFDSDINKIVRIDSQFVHSEAVKPALSLLTEKRFRSASEEFAKAHQHYRERRYEECIADCLKAFESTMKIICTTHSWRFGSGDTAKALISICFERGLIPDYLESQFSALRAVLESGLPTVRNKTSGHGRGSVVSTTPPHLASYALHLTASNIVFLAECEKQLR